MSHAAIICVLRNCQERSRIQWAGQGYVYNILKNVKLRHMFFLTCRSWVICKNKKRAGFYTLVFYIFINNSRSKQNEKNSKHDFVDIVK